MSTKAKTSEKSTQKKKGLQELALDFVNSRSELSYNLLYKRLKPGITKYIYDITKDVDMTNECVAIVFTKLYTRVDSYNPHFQFSTWAYRIARNEALMELQRRNVVTSLDNFAESGYEMPALFEEDVYVEMDEIMEERQPLNIEEIQYNMVISEIANIKSEYRDAFVKCELENTPVEEYSKMLGISDNAVRIRITRAKAAIKANLLKDPMFKNWNVSKQTHATN